MLRNKEKSVTGWHFGSNQPWYANLFPLRIGFSGSAKNAKKKEMSKPEMCYQPDIVNLISLASRLVSGIKCLWQN